MNGKADGKTTGLENANVIHSIYKQQNGFHFVNMNAIDRIIESLTAGKAEDPILGFGTYTIVEPKGGGGQAKVFRVEHPIGKSFALKLYHPTPERTVTVQENLDNFVREVGLLARINHKNIVGIKTAGFATFDKQSEEWAITEGLSIPSPLGDETYLFYVMDYVPQRASDVFPIAKKRFNLESDLPVRPDLINRKVELFERLVRHISDAIAHCHNQVDPLTHKDIKGDNILFREEDTNFVLADFGFAHRVKYLDQDEVIRRFETANPQLIHGREYFANDIYEFAFVLKKILPALRNNYDATRYAAFEDALAQATNPKHPRFPITDINSFKASLEKYFSRATWGLRLRIGDVLVPGTAGTFIFDSKIQIPVSGAVPVTPEVKEIIDTKAFQRLRGVRQLGPTYFIFPGAYHTRFEHALGAYHLALRYLESLTRLPIFIEYVRSVEDTVKLIALSALLHDVGHYPYSHWVEELHPLPHGYTLPRHEARARSIITESPIGEIIKSKWNLDPAKVSDVICGEGLVGPLILAHSVIDSVLDVDKLDYLVRDSVHCGVTYGQGLDSARLIDALHVDVERNRICLNRKGRSYLMSLLSCRNVMYQEVYWHKTVRACTGMFKTFFYHYLNRKIDTPQEVDRKMTFPDDVFISLLMKELTGTKNADLLPLLAPFAFEGRALYKPAYMLSTSHPNDSPGANAFFVKLMQSSSYETLVLSCEELARALKSYVPEIKPLDLVVEITPVKSGKEVFDLDQLRIWDSRKGVFEDIPKKTQELNEYLQTNRQAFVFCRPLFYESLRRLDSKAWGEIFEAVVAAI